MRHIKAILENIGLLIQCDQCDYKAKYKADVVNHFKSKHEGLKFPSDQCDFQAGTRQFLSEHFKSIHEDIKFPCDQCNYSVSKSIRTQEWGCYEIVLGVLRS